MERLSFKIPGYDELEGTNGMPDSSYSTFENFIRWGITVTMIVASLVCLALLIMGGIQWITSSGDKGGLEGARNRIIYALIGLVIIFSSFLIIQVVGNFFGLALLNFPD
jgi:hypothetical protein